MLFRINLIVLLTAFGAWGVTIETSVVKTYSGSCQKRNLFRGSGLLFKEGNDIYAVTSEHVVLHSSSSEEICHAIWQPGIGERKAELVSADWGMGLALLKVTDKSKLNVPTTIEIFDSPKLERSVSARTWGFPYKSDSLITDPHGRVLDVKSSRALIPLVPHLVETLDAHGEFGMSGGPVTTGNGWDLIGVLSHQYLKMIPGRADVVETFNNPNVGKVNHLLVIPSHVVGKWVRQVLSSTEQKPSSLRVFPSQLAGQTVVRTNKLLFSETAAKSGGKESGVGGGDAIGIGGGDAIGIGGAEGGGDPIGTGGDENAADFAVQVQVRLDPHGPVTQWDLFERTRWLSQLSKHAFRLGTVPIPFAVRRRETGGLEKIYFRSLAHFFILLRDPEVEPVALIGKGEASATPLMEEGKKLETQADALQRNIRVEDSLLAKELLTEIVLMGKLLSSTSNWTLVDPARIQFLSDHPKAAWVYLFNQHFDEAQALLQTLVRVHTEIKALRL